MSRRLAAGLAAAALCLAAAAALRARRQAPSERRPLAGVAPGAIVHLERRVSGETLTLSRKAGEWTADGLGPARKDLCAALAEGAARLALGPKVSDDPSTYEQYGLSDAQATRLRVVAEGSDRPVLTAYFGKTAYGSAVYARLADEAPIYVAVGIDPAVLALPTTGFLNSTVGSGTKIKDSHP